VTLYAVAAFHKLNADFVDVDVSCAGAGLKVLAADGAVVPDGLVTAVIAMTLACELGIPLLLTLRRTRRVGVAAAVLFNGLFYATGFPGIMSFSVAVFALLFWFLGPAAAREVAALLPRSAARRGVVMLAVGTWVVAAYVTNGPGRLTPLGSTGPLLESRGLAALCIAWAVGVAVILGVAMRRSVPEAPPAPRSRGRMRAAMLPAMVVLIGAGPYLGGQTAPAFSMFSNLRTDTDGWNHLLVPRWSKLTSWEDDRVLVTETDFFGWEHDVGREWPWVELERRVTVTAADFSLT